MWNTEDIAIVGSGQFPPESLGASSAWSAGAPSSQTVKGHVKSAWDNASMWPAIGSVPTETDWNPLAKANTMDGSSTGSVWSSQSRVQEAVAPVVSSSWSDVARKNVPSVSSQGMPMLRRGSGSSGFDPTGGTASWGKPVDQGTPWDVGATDSGVGKATADGATNESALSIAGTSWNSVSNRENAWSSGSSAPAKASVNEVVYWKTPYEKDQWGGNMGAVRTPSGWEEPPQTVTGRSNAWMSPETPSNVWTGPPVQQDSSMVWNNPYPKKSAMLDKGTGIWGDPDNQGEIKRWKTNTDDAVAASAPAVASTSVQRSPVLPVNNNNNSNTAASSVSKITSQQSTAMSSVWKDSPIAPRPIKPVGSAGSGSAWATSGVGPFGIGSLKGAGSLEGGNVASPWATDETGASSVNQASGVPCAAWTENHCASTPSSRHDSVNRRSVDSDAVPSDDVFASSPAAATSNASGTMQVLANQVAEQLTVAVKTGLIESHLLSQPLPPETLFKLNQLLQCITKLEQAESELRHLHSLSQKGPLNGAQHHEYQRISGEVNQLRATAHTLKNHINAHTAPIRKSRSSGLVGGGGCGNGIIGSSSSPSSSSTNQNNDLGNVVVVVTSSSSSSSSSGNSSAATASDLLLNGSKVHQWKHSSDIVLQEKSQNGDRDNKLLPFDMSAPSDPWSTSSSSKQQQQQQPSPFDWPCDAYLKVGDHLSNSAFHAIDQQQASSGSSSSATLDDGPPEFRPGQKWEWRDPREVAEDPNATPGSVKTSAISLTRLSGDSKLNAAAVVSSSHAVPDGSVAAGGVLYSPSTMLTVSSVATPKSYYDSKISNLSQNIVNDGWSAKSVRPPAQSLNMAYFNRAPRMVSSYANSAQFMPLSPAAQQWIVLLNAQLVDEQTLQFLFSRIGTVQAFVFPPGSGFAAVKFKDASAEKALLRLQPECSAIGLTAHLAKDAEVEKLIQTSNSHRQPLFQSGAPVAAHHGLVWDVPPPPSSWGPSAPPPHPPFGPPPPSVALHDHMALISHNPGPNSIYGDNYYGGMERHPTF
uniref:M_domain domain-containing protein n=1 Tax=Trichuris muris TaxID=70415 RepID=A0A5S6QSZ4_TRIMR